MQLLLRCYLAAVLDDEWTLRQTQSVSAEAEAALSSLSAGVWNLSGRCRRQDDLTTGYSSDPAISTYLQALEDLLLARDQRLRWPLALA